jgi:hypothetical protein
MKPEIIHSVLVLTKMSGQGTPGFYENRQYYDRGRGIELSNSMIRRRTRSPLSARKLIMPQHIGIYVDSVAGALREFKASGAKMLDEIPRSMPDGHKIGFVIPKNTEMLIELMEK